MTNKTKAKTATAVPQGTWEMASAVLVALHQTHLKAQAEYRERVKAAGDNHFAPGLTGARLMIETLKPALRQLEADMRIHARSGSLKMPKLER